MRSFGLRQIKQYGKNETSEAARRVAQSDDELEWQVEPAQTVRIGARMTCE